MESSAASKELRFIDSYHKNKLLVYDGHMYQINYSTKKATYFKCRRRVKGCRAGVVLYDFDRETCTFKDFKATAVNHTSHLPNPDEILRHEINTGAQQIVKENVNLKTSQVVDELADKFISTPKDAPSMGKITTLKRHIRHVRRKATGEKRIGTSREDFVLPKELQLTKTKVPFLLKDIPGKNRTLIFSTPSMLEILANDCTVWLLDGTFKLAPDWFTQVFTIHALYMDVCVPFVYSLLPGKKASDYSNVLDAVILSGTSGGFNPEHIISDFELGIIKACRDKFPHIVLHGCLFHLCQNIYRKVQSLGLTEFYIQNSLFRNAVRSLGALSFVPPGDVFMRFMEVKSFYGHCKNSKEVIDYFFSNYIGDTWEVTTFPIPFWNCYDRFIKKIPRTTNAVEGWHFKMNNNLTGSHPSTWLCIDKLQKEQKFWEEEMVRIRTGLGEGKRRRDKILDERLGKIVKHYNSSLGTIDYLTAISTCMYDHLDK